MCGVCVCCIFRKGCRLRDHHISSVECILFRKFERIDWSLAKNHNRLYGPDRRALVLHPNGTVENWAVTAYERREPVTGRRSVEGKTLTLSFNGNDRSNPFTFDQGQLVFPNIPNRRGFWEKIG
jgi:hypothetical protein